MSTESVEAVNVAVAVADAVVAVLIAVAESSDLYLFCNRSNRLSNACALLNAAWICARFKDL